LLGKFVPSMAGEQKTALINMAEGSLGRALKLHRDNGLALYKDLLKIISTLPALDVEAAHSFAEKNAKYGEEEKYETIREILTGWCGRLARLEARGQAVTDVFPGDAEIFRQIMDNYPPRHFMNTWDKLSQLFTQAENYNLDKKQVLLSACLMLQKPDYNGPTI
jgi:DNA polymerase-3 subunit delta'